MISLFHLLIHTTEDQICNYNLSSIKHIGIIKERQSDTINQINKKYESFQIFLQGSFNKVIVSETLHKNIKRSIRTLSNQIIQFIRQFNGNCIYNYSDFHIIFHCIDKFMIEVCYSLKCIYDHPNLYNSISFSDEIEQIRSKCVNDIERFARYFKNYEDFVETKNKIISIVDDFKHSDVMREMS